ncbi:MAG TPA: DUF362 domain-containing protein [Acidobacteriota bacterium]|nr:DUF362 domain-containing protein [Acidobacteriota bacterium]
MNARVAVVRCSSYEKPRLRDAIGRSLELIGGLGAIIGTGSKVFVKINHLSPGSPPERAIVTHPLFTRQVLEFLKDLGANITVGDDIQSGSVDGFEVSGYGAMCREMGVRLINLKSAGFREVPCAGGEALKSVHVSSVVLEADSIVDLPKLKTHSFTAFTGAVKNMFGVIPYGSRLELHSRFPGSDAFGRMLVDIFACVPPRLTLMDGIVAMEGPGPAGGSARPVGLVLAGRDAVAVDAIAQDLVGFGPDDVETTASAARRGLGTADPGAIEIAGEPLADVRVKRFRKASLPVGLLKRKLPAFLYAYVSGELVLSPEVVPAACTGCGECFNVCPRRAVVMEGGRARIHKEPCIGCLCCHEVCRADAIRLRQRPVGRAARVLASLFRL